MTYTTNSDIIRSEFKSVIINFYVYDNFEDFCYDYPDIGTEITTKLHTLDDKIMTSVMESISVLSDSLFNYQWDETYHSLVDGMFRTLFTSPLDTPTEKEISLYESLGDISSDGLLYRQ